MRLATTVVMGSALAGCGYNPNQGDVAGAVKDVLSGVTPDEEKKKLWKKMSQLRSDKFINSAVETVRDVCFKEEADFYKCQKNTQIMRDVDWGTFKGHDVTFVRTFSEGVRIYMSNPVAPMEEEIDKLRGQLRKAQASRRIFETNLVFQRSLVEAFSRFLDSDVTIIEAIKGDATAKIEVKGFDPAVAKTLIKRNLQVTKARFDEIKVQSEYNPLFGSLTFEDMKDESKLENLSGEIYIKIIN